MLSKMLKLESLKIVSKKEQRALCGGSDNPCGNIPWWQQQCQGQQVYAECDYSSNSPMLCDPCVMCVN
ncbi:hypothetical protein C8N46_106269 [Kordia periserrulae]|uniref:Uncharacterized protein n=1 Tax=Kordia periserrulae TaxID=701523 RepID=A0A2T6BX30_9FLAO|nr:hypothetical protein C8N46_106269 [Kordia periserrulae]